MRAAILILFCLSLSCIHGVRHPALDDIVPVVDVFCINDECDTLWYHVINPDQFKDAVKRDDTLYAITRRKVK